MLSRRFSLSLLAGAVLLAGPASAVSILYDMAGSSMQTFNAACNPCSVPVTGSLTLDDDGAGNVSITAMNLAHVGYQVGSPPIISIILTRTDISLGAGPVAAAPGGSTTTAAVFGGTTLNQTGTIACTDNGGLVINCTLAGFPPGGGTGPLPATQSIASMGTWTFDPSQNFTCPAPCIIYQDTPGQNPSTEILVLNGTVVPEPGTAVLMGIGLFCLALRRRATF